MGQKKKTTKTWETFHICMKYYFESLLRCIQGGPVPHYTLPVRP